MANTQMMPQFVLTQPQTSSSAVYHITVNVMLYLANCNVIYFCLLLEKRIHFELTFSYLTKAVNNTA